MQSKRKTHVIRRPDGVILTWNEQKAALPGMEEVPIEELSAKPAKKKSRPKKAAIPEAPPVTANTLDELAELVAGVESGEANS